MLSKMLAALTVGLAATLAILQADPIDALRQHHPPARRDLSTKGPIVAHAHHPHHHHKVHHERKKSAHTKHGRTSSRRLGESDYYDYDDSSSDDYGRHYGHGYGRRHGYGHGYGDSYDDSSDYGDSYDASSDYSDNYDGLDYGDWFGRGYGGGFGGYPPFLYDGLESAASPVGSGSIPAGVAPESAVSAATGDGAAPTPKMTTTEAKKTKEKQTAKSTTGAKK